MTETSELSSLDFQERISTATDIIRKLAPTLDERNVKGIMGFGSFWRPDNKRSPRDIDLAIYALNDAELDDEKDLITIPLSKQLHLPVEIHPLSPYTPMIKHQMEDYRVYLKNGVLLWGEMPSWLQK